MKKVVNHCSIQLFADDTLIYFHSKDLKHLMQTMNIELDKVSNWFNGNSLKLNIKKTKFMLLGNSRLEFEETKLSIMIKTEMIETVKNIKYLGFIVDNNLNFKEHILYIIEKLTKNIIFFSRVSVHLTQWSKITVYNTLIMPHLLFSASILYLANKNEINRLQKLQNRVMRIILKEKRDTLVMILIYKIKNGLTPNYLSDKLVTGEAIHSYPTRSNRTNISNRSKNKFYVSTKNKKSSENMIYHKGLISFNYQISKTSKLYKFLK